MEDREMTTKNQAEEAFRIRMDMIKESSVNFKNSEWLAEDHINIMLGQNILREEIGFYGNWDGVRYSFDEQTRDRLLAHGRQDTAMAGAMARSALREAYNARKLGERIIVMLAVSLFLNTAALVSFWL